MKEETKEKIINAWFEVPGASAKEKEHDAVRRVELLEYSDYSYVKHIKDSLKSSIEVLSEKGPLEFNAFMAGLMSFVMTGSMGGGLPEFLAGSVASMAFFLAGETVLGGAADTINYLKARMMNKQDVRFLKATGVWYTYFQELALKEAEQEKEKEKGGMSK